MKLTLIIFTFIFAVFTLNAQDNYRDTDQLGLPGDNLDLYAVLDLFQNSKTIEVFEASLNEEETGINNLDLNLDQRVDFIKVETKQYNKDFAFILQVDMARGDIQDVAVIYVTKEANDKVSLQIVGDISLYGNDYVIEPITEQPRVTPNPAYSGTEIIEEETVIIVESSPIIYYMYSPVYVHYYSPYYYGYYPAYYNPYAVIYYPYYHNRHYRHHRHYYGGHYGRGHANVIVHRNHNYDNYKRNRSSIVKHNKNEGKYRGNRPSKELASRSNVRPSKGIGTRSNVKPKGVSTRPNNVRKSSAKKATGIRTQPSTKKATMTRTQPTTRKVTRTQPSAKKVTRTRTQPTTRKVSRAQPSNNTSAKPATRSTQKRSK